MAEWVCPWGICNHEQAQECRATLRPRNGCGGRFPPGTTPEQARVLAGPAPSPLDRWVDEIVRVAVELDHVAAEENNAESAATLRQELLRIVMMPPPAAGVGVPAPADPRTVSAALRRLIADDAYAMTFQTMGQYRTALLKAISDAERAAGVGGTDA